MPVVVAFTDPIGQRCSVAVNDGLSTHVNLDLSIVTTPAGAIQIGSIFIANRERDKS